MEGIDEVRVVSYFPEASPRDPRGSVCDAIVSALAQP